MYLETSSIKVVPRLVRIIRKGIHMLLSLGRYLTTAAPIPHLQYCACQLPIMVASFWT